MVRRQRHDVNGTSSAVQSEKAVTQQTQNICTMSAQRLRRWADIVQMFCVYFTFRK